MQFLGEFTISKTIRLRFNTHQANGTPITLAGTPAISVYKGSTTESTAGVTLTVDYDSRTGLHDVVIDTSADGTFYAAGNDFDVVITAGTVDSISVVGTVVGTFSLQNRAGLRPTTADKTLDVTATGGAGIDWSNVENPTTTLALTGTTIATTQKVDVETIKTNAVVNGGTITFPTGATLASTTNITAAAGCAVSSIGANVITATAINADAITAAKIADGAIDAATFAAGAINAAAIAADAITAAKIADGAIDTATFAAGTTIPRCTLVDTISTYTGNTPQTGDAFARIGATGSGLTSLAPSATALSTVTWTGARAVYLDNLNVGGNVASSAEVTSIQNNTRVVRVVPEVIERPDSGTTTYRIELLLYDDVGNMEAPDSAPTIALVNQAGTDRSSRLDSTTMALVSTGRYRAIYTADVADTLEQLVWAFSVVEGGATRIYGNTSVIVDTSAVDFTAADRTKLDGVFAKLPANNIADETLVLAAVGSPMQAGSTVVLTDGSLTTAKLGTFVLAKTTNITGFNDIAATAVWAAASRTLTAFAFTVTVGSLTLDAGTLDDIGDAVWEGAETAHDTAGTMGRLLHTAGSGGDPFTLTLGSYGSNTAGGALQRIGTGTIEAVWPALVNGKLRLIVGDSYTAAISRALEWDELGPGVIWPDLSGVNAKVWLLLTSLHTSTLVQGAITAAAPTSPQRVSFDLTHAQTVLLKASEAYRYTVYATLDSLAAVQTSLAHDEATVSSR